MKPWSGEHAAGKISRPLWTRDRLSYLVMVVKIYAPLRKQARHTTISRRMQRASRK
jgi:hypothetical protein